MALYIFENMSADDAIAFTSADTLIFASATTTPSDVVVSNINALNATTVTAGGKTLTFAGDELEGSTIQFASTDATFVPGSNNGDTLQDGGLPGDSQGQDNIYYGFGGDDSISAGSGNDNIFGGAGDDSINGGDGNDHLYGYGLTGDPTTDGDDSINGGNGNDYIQGNAGDDTLRGGDDNDRVNGGSGDDSITGGNGNDTVNGNKGDDSISGNDGNDSLRGGAGNDTVQGDAGNDILLGDLGDDSINGGSGVDLLTGGAGDDVFLFTSTGDSAFAETGTLAYFTDTITDYTVGEDTLDINHTPLDADHVLYQADGVAFTTVAAALTYAQQLFDDADGDDNNVAAIQVGADTYLFFDDNAVADDVINSAIKLTGVTATDVTDADFV